MLFSLKNAVLLLVLVAAVVAAGLVVGWGRDVDFTDNDNLGAC